MIVSSNSNSDWTCKATAFNALGGRQVTGEGLYQRWGKATMGWNKGQHQEQAKQRQEQEQAKQQQYLAKQERREKQESKDLAKREKQDLAEVTSVLEEICDVVEASFDLIATHQHFDLVNFAIKHGTFPTVSSSRPEPPRSRSRRRSRASTRVQQYIKEQLNVELSGDQIEAAYGRVIMDSLGSPEANLAALDAVVEKTGRHNPNRLTDATEGYAFPMLVGRHKEVFGDIKGQHRSEPAFQSPHMKSHPEYRVATSQSVDRSSDYTGKATARQVGVVRRARNAAAEQLWSQVESVHLGYHDACEVTDRLRESIIGHLNGTGNYTHIEVNVEFAAEALAMSEEARRAGEVPVFNVETYCFEGHKGWQHEAQHWSVMQAMDPPMSMLNGCEQGTAADAKVTCHSVTYLDQRLRAVLGKAEEAAAAARGEAGGGEAAEDVVVSR